jgi:hypothetical protein
MPAWKPCHRCGETMIHTDAPQLPTLCPRCAAAQQWSHADDAAYLRLRAWFFAHYTDPAEVCPYVSAEGGYQHLWGGPYDAFEVLDEHWGHAFTETFLASVATRLEEETDCVEWSAVADED